MRRQAQGAESSSADAAAAAASIQRRVAAIEDENERLRNRALRTSRLLSQSRKIMDAYLGLNETGTAEAADGVGGDAEAPSK